jgi:hypothetical protein
MKQQTAVEWLMRQSFGEDFRMKVNDHQLNLFQQAKQMEKEQSLGLIRLASELTGVVTVDEEIGKMEYIDVYEQYYNETYNK